MFVHLGHGVSVRAEDVIALTDMTRPLAEDTAGLLARMRGEGRVRVLGDSPKTMVLCRSGAGCVCTLSCVGLRTLRARMAGPALPRATAADDNEDRGATHV